tara:strand:- start:5641 stop:6090 length:450 start_codon:yes stop_codon:yes gene_type:complete
MKNQRFNVVAGLVLIIIGIFLDDIREWIPEVENAPAIDISEPTDIMLGEVRAVCDLVTDPDDRLKMCVFNKVFADRIPDYNITAQQTNDLYVDAAKNFFGDSVRGKYDNLSVKLKQLIESVITNEDHRLIEPEKRDLNKKFMALAWCLR